MPGCAWAVFDRRRIRDASAVGVADPRDARPLHATTAMRIASISKLATTLVLLQLVGEQSLSLDEDVSAALGFELRNPAHPSAPITARHILSHTSSLRDGEVYWAGLGERLADFFRPGTEHWEGGAHWSGDRPGERFAYCNLGFGVIATMIENLDGRRFDLITHERLLAPLGLSAGFNWSGVESDAIDAASPIWRRIEGAWAPQIDDPLPVEAGAVFLNPRSLDISSYRPGDNGALFSPQGGLRASVCDLARLGLLLLGPSAPFLSSDLLGAMRTPHWRLSGDNGDSENGFWRAYGLGAQILEPGGGAPIIDLQRPLFGHSGDAYGLRGGLWIDPAAGSGFAFLFNGGPDDATRAAGLHSAFLRSEEHAMQILYEAL